jgi:GNAT superfamily N-acetyltransferase
MKASAVVIRVAVPDDAASIAAIHEAAVTGERGRGDYDDGQIDAWAHPWTLAQLRERIGARRFLIAESASKPVAYAQLDVDAAVIRSVYVTPRHRRQGVGRRLAQTLVEVARGAGLERLELASSLNAAPFYERLGFARLENVDHTLRSGVVMPCVRMAKELSDESRTTGATIAYLADHPEAIPVLAEWFANEWGGVGPRNTVEGYRQSLSDRANRDRLPVCLLGLLDGEPVATATLKFREIEYSEAADFWLGAVYVRGDLRGRGHGGGIVAAAEALAVARHFTPLYLYTPSNEALYCHLGWQTVGTTTADGKPATVMAKYVE